MPLWSTVVVKLPPDSGRPDRLPGEIGRHGPLSPWPVCLVVADGWIVRAQFADELTLDVKYLRVRSVLGLPEDLLTDHEISQFFPGEVLTDQLVAGTSEVVGTVCQVAADLDFPVRVCDLINDLEPPVIHSCILGSSSSPLRSDANSPTLVVRRARSGPGLYPGSPAVRPLGGTGSGAHSDHLPPRPAA